MRALAALLLLVCAAVSVPAGGGTEGARVYSRYGLHVTVPAGWHGIARRLTPCVDPAQRLAVARRGALVMVQEQLAPPDRWFPARPKRLELEGRPAYIPCCAPLGRRGWLLRFRDAGRGFYVYAYVGGTGTRAQVVQILNSLRVDSLPRGR